MNSCSTINPIDVANALCLMSSSDLLSADQHINWYSHTLNCESARKCPYIISIDGNIGAGKSTLIEKLQNIYLTGSAEEKRKYFGKLGETKIVFMKEPVDVWTSICHTETGESILEKFYKNPKEYSFPFQVMIYITHLEEYRRVVRENPDCAVLICERSIDAGRHIFTQMLKDDGMIDDLSFQIYKRLFDSTANEFPLSAVMHLEVSPEVCLKQVEKRARDGESAISLEYLEKCDAYYKKWLL